MSYQDALTVLEAPWTISGVLGGLGLLWGEAGTKKTFVACSMAASVATGRPWMGHGVTEGPVVYIVGEGGAAAIARRLDAAVAALRCCDPEEGPVPIWLITPGIDLVKGPAELAALLGEIRPELTVVDTLSRCFGGDENKQEDMSQFVRTLDLIRDCWGGSVLVVHHANKNPEARGAGKVRGSSVLYGAVDVALQLVQIADGEVSLRADKLRERDVTEPIADLRFESVVIPGERDELGDARTTLVVRPGAWFAKQLAPVALVAIRAGIITYEQWRAASMLDKHTFDRAVTAILGDRDTWGLEAIVQGVYGLAAAGQYVHVADSGILSASGNINSDTVS